MLVELFSIQSSNAQLLELFWYVEIKLEAGAPTHKLWGSFSITREEDTKSDIIYKANYNWWPKFGDYDILLIIGGVEIVKETQQR